MRNGCPIIHHLPQAAYLRMFMHSHAVKVQTGKKYRQVTGVALTDVGCSQTVSGFTLPHWKQSIGNETWQQRLSEVLDLLAKGIVTTYNGKTYQLEDVKDAIVEAQRPARGGKVFLKG